MKDNIYSFKVPGLSGQQIDFSQFKGKKILVVNTASKCGFTPQYADLEKLYKRFEGKLVIVGFPANNFGHQEPGTNKEISQFCTNNYQITFPMAAKVSVKGEDTAPIYQWLEGQAQKKGLDPSVPQWNFHKYLLNESGELVAVFPSKVNPMSEEIIKAVVAQ
ncbi:glutathione peroxidase [Compostibacter hankyongensis]|uniref:Glutathione peroxidase n=2 Tax=Compostibacter hankyongensis TaxID=1007089 RepID=A0ABP8G5C1_9BACT